MWLNFLGELVLIGVMIGCIVLLRRVWRVRHLWLRWLGGLLVLLPLLLFGAASVFVGIGLYKLYAPLGRPIPTVKVASTAEQIARGEHLANVLCVTCHALNSELPLSGGEDISKASPVPIGAIVPPNLTPGGDLQSWSDGEIMRALRDGIDRNGYPLLMPIKRLRNLSDDDIQAIIAYLRNQPATENKLPHSSPNLLLLLFIGAGLAGASPVDLAPLPEGVSAPPKAATPAYGEYLVNMQDCRECHDEQLQGRPKPGLFPVSPPVLPFIRAWSQAEFIQTMRTGIAPGGQVIKPPMPAKVIGRLDDVELTAIYQYLRSLAN